MCDADSSLYTHLLWEGVQEGSCAFARGRERGLPAGCQAAWLGVACNARSGQRPVCLWHGLFPQHQQDIVLLGGAAVEAGPGCTVGCDVSGGLGCCSSCASLPVVHEGAGWRRGQQALQQLCCGGGAGCCVLQESPGWARVRPVIAKRRGEVVSGERYVLLCASECSGQTDQVCATSWLRCRPTAFE